MRIHWTSLPQVQRVPLLIRTRTRTRTRTPAPALTPTSTLTLRLTPTLTLNPNPNPNPNPSPNRTLPQEQRVPFVLPGPQLRVVARPDILAVTR